MSDDNNEDEILMDEGDYLVAHEGLYEEMDAHGNGKYDEFNDTRNVYSSHGDFPPKISSYVGAVTHNQLELYFNGGRQEAWEQAKKEIKYIRNQLGYNKEAELKVFDLFFGKESVLFGKWRDITRRGSSYEEFCKFIATFFFECTFSKTYSWLCNHNNVDTSHYLDQNRYKELWLIMENYKRNMITQIVLGKS